jgi:hypothetical protein
MTPQSAAALLKRGECDDLPPKSLAEAVQCIADELVKPGASISNLDVRRAMQALNRYRHFDHVCLIGRAWHDTRDCDARIQRYLVQALIELGALDAADTLLDEGMERATAPNSLDFVAELAEYHGLRGRIRKQKFVQSEDCNFLSAATDAYLRQYEARGDFWQGVNVIALRLLEERLGLPERDGGSVPEMARAVLESACNAHRRNARDPWPLAAASEASLALEYTEPEAGWSNQAELWLYRFLAHPTADPFMIESYYRQLREVWNGDPLGTGSCADRLAGIIDRHVVHTQKCWSVEPRRARELASRPDVLEKNFSGEKTFTVANLQGMLALCPSIGCVVDKTGVRLGSGFLMPGSTFGLRHKLVFVTNAHVVSDTVPGALRSADARVMFEIESVTEGIPRSHAVDEILFTSEPEDVGRVLDKPEKLDVTIVSLKTLPSDVQGLSRAANIPLPAPTTKAFVVGHPKAGPLQFSVHDSVLLDVCPNDRLMHYRTPTEPGSSGSPVFNSKWEVIALHHAGSQKTPRLSGLGEYEANEGITLRSICLAMGLDV